MLFGLPTHPLIVHLVVVLLPLSALGFAVIIIWPTLRRRLGGLAIAGLIISAIAAFIATRSGEFLADHVGRPDRHAALGQATLITGAILAAIATAWFILSGLHRPVKDSATSPPGAGQPPAARILGITGAILAVAVIVLTIMTGHSGSTAAWDDVVDETSAPEEDTAPAGPFTMNEVSAHDTPDSCWAVIDGAVYDLTEWIEQHPGGASRIENLCGTDATDAFYNQHSGDETPAEQLATFEIGELETSN